MRWESRGVYVNTVPSMYCARSVHTSMAWQNVSSFCHNPSTTRREETGLRGEGKPRLCCKMALQGRMPQQGRNGPPGVSQREPTHWTHVAVGTG